MPRPKHEFEGVGDFEEEVPAEEPSIAGGSRKGLDCRLNGGGGGGGGHSRGGHAPAAAPGLRSVAYEARAPSCEVPAAGIQQLEEDQQVVQPRSSLPPCASSCSLDSASDIYGQTPSCLSDVASSYGLCAAPDLSGAGLPPIPDVFRCPVSQQIMEDPVTLEDGRTVERSNVATLGYEGPVIPNEPLRDAIQGYFELHREIERRQNAWLAHMARHERRVARALVHKKKQVDGLKVSLYQSRRKVQELSERRKTCGSLSSTTASSSNLEEVDSSNTTTGTPSGSDRSNEEDKVAFKSGPAPRCSEATNAAIASQERRRRASAWSRLLPSTLSRRGGA